MSDWDRNLLCALPGHAAARHCLTIRCWLEGNAERFAGRPAVAAPGRRQLTHLALYRQVLAHGDLLRSLGIGRGDIVAIAIADGPEALTTILAVASVGVVLPIAVDEPAPAIERLLDTVPIKATILDSRRSSPLRDVVARQPSILRLAIDVQPRMAAGELDLQAPAAVAETGVRGTRLDDAAMLARTAGTTAEPKLIAWSQASLYLSALAVGDWMGLTADDRSLCMMPFIHLHSLIRSSLPGLLKGGSVICCPGFDRIRVLSWLSELQPTYMTAVPEIYRSLLARVEQTGWRPDGVSLRFVATGSDQIDSTTVEALHRTLRIPILEFYGLSEVTPMLAASPRGALARSTGAVGEPLSCWDIVCVGPDGQALARGQEGEIAARGGLINPVLGDGGYDNRYAGERLLTGDCGWLDEQGMLHVSGRVDERINSGGQKISPRTVERVLSEHPAVHQAVVFPVPDDAAGARVAAAVVPVPGSDVEPRALRVHTAERLPAYMVPETIVFRDRLPGSRIGKISRRMLAHALGLDAGGVKDGEVAENQSRYVPLTHTESVICHLARELLEIAVVDVEADFMDIGGNSFLATALLAGIEDRLGVLISPARLLACKSLSSLARAVDEFGNRAGARIFEVQTGDGPLPLHFTHGLMGYSYYAHTFARYLGPAQAVYTLQWQEPPRSIAEGFTFEEYASECLGAIRQIQPDGPYALAGHSFGAQLAFEIAQQLIRAGERVPFLGLIDDDADLHKRRFDIAASDAASRSVLDRCQRLLHAYVPATYSGDVCLFFAGTKTVEHLADPYLGWRDLVTGSVERFDVPGDHVTMMSDATVERWAPVLAECLARARQPAGGAAPSRTAATPAASDLTLGARRAAKAGDRQRELACYRAAIAEDPDQPFWVYRNLGHALLEDRQVEDALRAFARAIEGEAVPLEGNLLLATVSHELGRRQEAEHCLRRAVQVCPDLPHAHYALADYLAENGQPERSQAHFERVVEQQPDYTYAYVRLSHVVARQGRLVAAVEIVEQALERDPNNPHAHHYLGNLLADSGDDAGSEAAQRRALELLPELAEAHAQLGRLLVRRGRLSEALPAIKRAHQLKPDDAELRRILESDSL